MMTDRRASKITIFAVGHFVISYPLALFVHWFWNDWWSGSTGLASYPIVVALVVFYSAIPLTGMSKVLSFPLGWFAIMESDRGLATIAVAMALFALNSVMWAFIALRGR